MVRRSITDEMIVASRPDQPFDTVEPVAVCLSGVLIRPATKGHKQACAGSRIGDVVKAFVSREPVAAGTSTSDQGVITTPAIEVISISIGIDTYDDVSLIGPDLDAPSFAVHKVRKRVKATALQLFDRSGDVGVGFVPGSYDACQCCIGLPICDRNLGDGRIIAKQCTADVNNAALNAVDRLIHGKQSV